MSPTVEPSYIDGVNGAVQTRATLLRYWVVDGTEQLSLEVQRLLRVYGPPAGGGSNFETSTTSFVGGAIPDRVLPIATWFQGRDNPAGSELRFYAVHNGITPSQPGSEILGGHLFEIRRNSGEATFGTFGERMQSGPFTSGTYTGEVVGSIGGSKNPILFTGTISVAWDMTSPNVPAVAHVIIEKFQSGATHAPFTLDFAIPSAASDGSMSGSVTYIDPQLGSGSSLTGPVAGQVYYANDSSSPRQVVGGAFKITSNGVIIQGSYLLH
ncbi:hypothetical protein PIB19_00535 [Sphingomonas sp. 7/4-4]|uniref:hypothetical protein n=1 Tax=Sphingomonas sp. 7/4-4 TaxID=3018446 RepID=UPI0022F3C19D|nr:hypothetical protein [Sphingomonas sp. 7/4-4]WBY08085.1 hypothetical protein PIB19_00535 [Sphingomonas sp. 7/4-4]